MEITKKTLFYFLLLLIVVLAGCSGKANIDQAILFQAGDLPDNITAGQIENAKEWVTKDLPDTDAQIYKPLEKNGKFTGAILLLQYNSSSKLEDAYQAVLDRMGDYRLANQDGSYPVTIEAIGEKSAVATVWDPMGHSFGIYTADIAFTRCNTLVIIRYGDEHTQGEIIDYLISYAKNIDNRIIKEICSE